MADGSAVWLRFRPVPASRQACNARHPPLGPPPPPAPPPPLFTVADSQSLRGQIAGGHTKNLFLKDKAGSLLLVVAEEDAAIELKSIHRRLASKRVSFGSAELLL